MHAERLRTARQDGRPGPTLDDARHAAALMLIVMFGDALFGPMAREGVGLGI